MEEWKEYKLGEICTKIGSGATPKGGKEAYLGGDTSLIRSQNVLDFSFSWDGLAYIDDEQATKLNGVEIAKGDVLLNITGDSVARACIVPESALPARVNQHVSIIRGDTSLVLNDYIMYFLQYKKPYLLSLSQGGATRNALTKGMIEDLAIPLPPLSKQKEIVRVLKNLDDKIEVNRRINKNLEQQAQALFEETIMNESFPRTKILNDYAFINPLRSLSKGAIARYIDMSSLPTKGSFPTNWEQKEYKGGMKFQNGDTIMARITPCLENGKTAYINFLDETEIAFGSTEYIVLSAHSDFCSEMLYFLARYDDFVVYAVSHMNGSSGRQRVSGNDIANYVMPDIPTENIVAFEKQASIIMNTIKNNSLESRRLAELRDALLPKLMSGEINVNEVCI